MKKLVKFLTGLILVGAISCASIDPSIVEEVRFSRAKDAIVRVSYDRGTCTAFHVGNHKFITAQHCLDTRNASAQLVLIDQQNREHKAEILAQFPQDDVAVIYAETFRGPKLELWNDKEDGTLRPGTEIMTIGYPGYYFIRLTFEIGHVRETNFNISGTRFISSRDTVFRGQSGGPTIALKNGKVIGMNDALIENIDQLGPYLHQHGSISLYVPYDTLSGALNSTN